MRVLVVDPWLFTPPYDEELCEALAGCGHEVVLVGSDSPMVSGNRTCGSFGFEQLFHQPPERLPRILALAVKGVSHLAGTLRLLRYVRRFQPDIIHFQWLPLPALDAVALVLFQRLATTVATVHDTNPYNGAGPLPLRFGIGRLLSRFDHLIVHNDVSVDNLSAQGLDGPKLHKVPHGLPTRTEANMKSVEPSPLTTFLQFGKVKEYKGVDVLLAATARLGRPQRARCRVQVTGKSYIETDSLAALVEREGLGDTVELAFDFVDDNVMDAMIATADCVVFPYRSIDTSAVLMETISRGVPVIASDIGCFSEVLTDGVDSLLVPPDDPDALAVAMTAIVDEPELLNKLRQGVADLRDRVPSWAEAAAMTADIYNEARMVT